MRPSSGPTLTHQGARAKGREGRFRPNQGHTLAPGWEQLDLWGGDYRSRDQQRRDRQRVWQAYVDCLTLAQARAALPDVPEADFRAVWPDRCPMVPDSSLDRRRVMEAVEELGPEGALAWLGEGLQGSDLDWLRGEVGGFEKKPGPGIDRLAGPGYYLNVAAGRKKSPGRGGSDAECE